MAAWRDGCQRGLWDGGKEGGKVSGRKKGRCRAPRDGG